MPASTTPIFPNVPVIGVASINTASTIRTYTDSSTLTKIVDAGANGTRIDAVKVIARGNTTAGIVRLVFSDGTNYKMLDEVLVSSITVSSTVAAFKKVVVYPSVDSAGVATEQLLLKVGESLWCGTHNADPFNVFAFGGHY